MIADATISARADHAQALGALWPLAAHRQFILAKLVPLANGKADKLPIDHRTGNVCDAHDPAVWTDHTTAAALAAHWGGPYRVGFVLTAADPFWVIDLDSCHDGQAWAPDALQLLAALPGTVVEISQSGRGLHIWGQGAVPPHGCKRMVESIKAELYTERRFIALGTGAQGDMSQPCPTIAGIAAAYFPPDAASAASVPESGPCPEWRGPTDDAELIRRALQSRSAANAFGTRASFADLWTANAEALARAYPAQSSTSATPYDASSADAALAAHLAWWTGRDVARIERLMRQSALARPKWDDRADYLVERTIRGACARQVDVMRERDAMPPPSTSTADAVIASTTLLPNDELRAQWADRAIGMTPADVERWVEWVAHRTGIGKQALKAELRQQRHQQKIQAADASVAALAGPKALIEHRPDACTEQAAHIETLILQGAAPGEYVVFGGVLAHVTARPLPHTHLIDQHDAAPPDVPQIEPLNDVGILRHVERRAAFYEITASGTKKLIGVPDRIIRVLMGKTTHAAPVLTGLVTHPVVLPGGEILAADGLHPGTGLYVWSAPAKDARPYTQHEAAYALQRLRASVLDGFEFMSPLDADVALAGLFTAVQRRVLDSAPGLAVLASMQASGKTTLARRLHILLTARDMPASTFPFDNEAEASKQLLSMLLRGPAMVCFDNVPDGYAFSSGALSAAMTSPEITQRILGVSKDASAPTNVFFALTGNNLSLGADEVTRWMIARLAPGTAKPEERRFAHPDVLAHGLAIREQALRDVVGIVAGCRLAGGFQIQSATRFPAWDRLVRQPLQWAGAQDVAEVFRANRNESEPVKALRSLIWALQRLAGEKPFTVSSLSTLGFGATATAEAAETLKGAFERLGAKDAASAVARGKVLKAQVGKVAEVEGEEWAIRSHEDRKGLTIYTLARLR